MFRSPSIRPLTPDPRPPLVGFTLIELLVVIAIIGLLATFAMLTVANVREQTRDAKRVADIKQIQNALDLYATTTGGYSSQEGLVLDDRSFCLLHQPGNATGFIERTPGNDFCARYPTAVLMGMVPRNPKPGGMDYVYDGSCSNSFCDDYTLTFVLEGKVNGLTDGWDGISVCTATSAGMTCAQGGS